MYEKKYTLRVYYHYDNVLFWLLLILFFFIVCVCVCVFCSDKFLKSPGND